MEREAGRCWGGEVARGVCILKEFVYIFGLVSRTSIYMIRQRCHLLHLVICISRIHPRYGVPTSSSVNKYKRQMMLPCFVMP